MDPPARLPARRPAQLPGSRSLGAFVILDTIEPVNFNRHNLNSPFLEALSQRVLLYDGAMGTQLLARQDRISDADYLDNPQRLPHELLGTTRPDLLEEIHAEYLAAGADVLETDTFQGTPRRLAEYGLADRAYEINLNATLCARRAADRFSTPDRPRFVAGSIGPTGALPSSDDPVLGNVTFEELVHNAHVQAKAFVDGGADVIIIETQIDLIETKAMIFGCTRAFEETGKRLPIQCQVTLDTSGRMLFGTDIAAALTTLESLAIDVIGLNCSTGPDYMREPMRYLCENSRLPVSCIPNAGLPINVDGQPHYPMGPEEMGKDLIAFVRDLGANIIGGCCGTTTDHIQHFRSLLGESPVPNDRRVPYVPRISSALRSINLEQEPAPLIVGERVNSLGSREAKRALLKDDYDKILQIARGQVETGSHALDVCVATTERTDEADQMRTVVKKLSMSVETPLVIDTTEYDVVKAALEVYSGRAILNSINAENRAERIDKWMPLIKAHGAATVAICIDEIGQAVTADRKVECAQKIYDIVCGEYGLPPDTLIFDAVTLPVSTGQEDLRDAAVETIEGIRRIKETLPGVHTILGVSNLSFGLTPHARGVLNSVFLYHAVKAGLDLAIINPAHTRPYAEIPQAQRALAEDLIYNRSPEALAKYIQHFEGLAPETSDGAGAKEDAEAGLSVDQKLHFRILHRKKEGVEDLIDRALADRAAAFPRRHDAAVDVLNGVLLPAMKEVGDKFGAGELILPYVLQSAEVMKKTVAYLEQFLEKVEGVSKGKVVIATVYGDVHDIGKSLVNTILTNNGYTVYDIGKQVPVNTIIDKAIEVNADAIGLSALLVNTSKQMPLCVQELHKRELNIPVLIGGAAINRRFGRRANFVDPATQETLYEAGVFYCKDAFEGLDTVEQLVDPKRADLLLSQHFKDVLEQRDEEKTRAASPAARAAASVPIVRRSPAVKDAAIPTPPFWGHRTVEIDWRALDQLLPFVDRNTLFRGQWRYIVHDRAEWTKLVETELEPRLQQLWLDAKQKRWLQPKAIYGYFPVQADGNDLIVYSPDDYANGARGNGTGRKPRELVRFTFPRQVPDGTKRNEDQLCLSDYFRPIESGDYDVCPLQVVTAGQAASEYTETLRVAGEYNTHLQVHGVSVQAAEAMAEYVHALVRRELGLPEKQGSRYSWGYPACPDLEDQDKLFTVMPVTQEIGVRLTEGFQLDPEQSTAAIVVHHPQAKYFSVLGADAGVPEPVAAG
ncbi:MAG TPA: methionine synthase [Chloroflexota bacterium]|nr:methionine synthase [Chloroflexota bacterium]